MSLSDREIIRKFKIKSTDRILDIGGSMKQREGLSVDTLVDILRPEEVPYTPGGLLARNFVWLDITRDKLPFKDKEFDFCFCSHTLEDLSYPFLVLEEMERVAKRGLIVTPSFGSDIVFSHIDFTDWLTGTRRVPGFGHHKWLFYKKDRIMQIVPKNYAVLYSSEFHITKWFGEEDFEYYWEGKIKYKEIKELDVHALIGLYRKFIQKNRSNIRKGPVLLYLDNPFLYVKEALKFLTKRGYGFTYRKKSLRE